MLAHRQMYYRKRYLKEAQDMLGNMSESGVESLEGMTYENLRNKINYLDIFLFNLFADESKFSMSYRKLRKQLDKNGYREKWMLPELPQAILELLNQLNNLRNWGAHIPESMLFAEFEVAEKYNKPLSKDLIVRFSTPITVNIYNRYKKEWFEDLFNESQLLQESYSKLLQQMKRDYSKLIGKSVEILTRIHDTPRPNEESKDIPGISFEMQNKTYKKDNT